MYSLTAFHWFVITNSFFRRLERSLLKLEHRYLVLWVDPAAAFYFLDSIKVRIFFKKHNEN